MSGPTQRSVPDDTKLTLALVRRRVITEGQLKAAMDYQRSLGGRISDILVKLDLVRPAQLEDIQKNPEGMEPTVEVAETATDFVLDPGQVKAADLKVHRRLLDKVPRELADKYLIVLFFPVPSGDPRKIVMGHGREIPAEVTEKVRATLGVELCTLALDARLAQEFLAGDPRQEPPRRQAVKSPPVDPAAHFPESASPASLAEALANLLVKKGIVTRDELETEMRLEPRSRSRVVRLKQ